MLRVTLKRSYIGYNKRQRDTVRALGLNKVGSSAVRADSAPIRGMIRKVAQLVEVMPLSDPVEVKE